jgi:hypothetical protein
MKPIRGITIGADVELFLATKATREIVSAEGYIKGTKYEPFQFDPNYPDFATSLDNVMAEFSIPPVTAVESWVQNLMKAVEYINSVIPETLCTVATPAAILDAKFLQTDNAKLFGCEPDYNVYLRDINPKPCASNECLRSAGGHIHVGYEGASDSAAEPMEGIFKKELIVKAMDLGLGIPSVLQEPENERKRLYGKAGAFRMKKYGIEYRTMSNYYLENETFMKWAYSNTMWALDFLNNGGYAELESVSDQVQEAINKNNKVLASNLVRQFEIPMAQ